MSSDLSDLVIIDKTLLIKTEDLVSFFQQGVKSI